MLPLYQILGLGGVFLWDCAVVGVVLWRTLRVPRPKLLKPSRRRNFREPDPLEIERGYTDMW